MATWSSYSSSHSLLSLLFTLWWLAVIILAQPPTGWTTSPFNPPSLPLAVKNPYLNAWAPLAGVSAAASQAWPRSYLPLINELEWFASIRVDGATYKLLGEVSLPNVTQANQTGFTFTPTQTLYTLACGSVSVELDFVTPIEAMDLVRLSTPFSYLQITASSSDGKPHSVQVYSDISGAWIAGDLSQVSGWAVDDSDEFHFVSLQRQLQNPVPFTEVFNRPQDATVYYAANKSDSLSWQIGPSQDTRLSFANGTKLSSSIQTGKDAIGPPSTNNTILGLAIDLGTIQSQNKSAVFALGIVRDPVMQYTNGQGKTENRTGYYWSKFANINNVMADVLEHFPDALASANALDASISQAAQIYGSDYANLLSLSTRQAMAAIEYTLPKGSSSDPGQLNTSDIKAFVKDMGYVGTADPPTSDLTHPASVNPVDVMYAAMPAYLYLNPNILGYLLRPLLEFQDSAQYTNPYAAQNLGSSFPNATGNTKAHNQGIEQSANMLIMSLAHAQVSGDGSLLTQHYHLLNEWGNYLIQSALNPQQQVTSLSDGVSNTLGSVNNQTNLALKGIIGIGAMAKIAEALDRLEDAQRYSDAVSTYASQWKSLALVGGQPIASLGSSTEPGFLYNLFADSLLGLNITDSTVYNDFTTLLSLETSIGKSSFGIPLQTTSTTARADWMLFAAAITTDPNVRTSIISQVVRYNSQSLIGANQPFPVVYNANTGEQGPVGQGSPAVGAMYAPLALTISKKTISSNNTAGSSGGDSGTSHNNQGNSGGSTASHLSSGAIAGIVVGCVVLVCGLVVLLWVLYRKRNTNKGGPSLILDMDELPHGSSTQNSINTSYVLHPYSYGTPGYPSDTTPLTSQVVSGPSSYSQTSSGILPNPHSVAGESIEPSTSVGSPVSANGGGSSRDTQRNGTQVNSELLSEMSRLREEVSRMRSAVEQGNAPPPEYSVNQGELWQEEAPYVTPISGDYLDSTDPVHEPLPVLPPSVTLSKS
ncbi:hypothetical protein BDY19DRAFT_195871 [Irpex rosettiformis]|uniref:Uncharacterized protein n=1 Tax=Irpex rosettiformis TaxID=378272 RepID=A0ACB8U2S9_9APHY|nr:hypothetical protein BDY19DRAFT_195871 [Irpex rosettiformis]